MKHRTPVLAVVMLLTFIAAMTVHATQKSDAARVAMEAAKKKEIVDSDPKAAIEQYKAIVSKYKTDRATVADALIRMAECYQKLGDAQASQIFAQVARDYMDQPAAVAIAQARLRGSGAPSSTVLRKVLSSGQAVDPEARVSPDGRYISYPAWDSFDLGLRDLMTGTDRLLTNSRNSATGEYAEGSSFSRDGKQLAYAWFNGKDRYELRVTSVQATASTPPRRVFDDAAVGFIAPLDWSPDGKWIACVLSRKNRTEPEQYALIAVADGALRVLKSIEPDAPSITASVARMAFSPDGAYLAYERPVTNLQSDIYIVRLESGSEIPAVVHSADDVLMGWSPAGDRLLFTSDRRGSVGLYALPFTNGQPRGTPELLKPDIGSIDSFGLTTSGALYFHKGTSTRDVTFAPIDLAAGRLTGPPVAFTEGFIDGPLYPHWSHDGNYLAYPACDNRCLAIRSAATGQIRRLPATLRRMQSPNWSPDDRSLLVQGRDLQNRQGIFQVNVESGEAKAVVFGEGITANVQWSPDGKKIYFGRNNAFVERDLTSGTERDVYKSNDRRAGGLLSPDGQSLAVRNTDAAAKTTAILLVNVADGRPRELLKLAQPEGIARGEWTPDSSAVIIDKTTGVRHELWLVPVRNGQPRKLDIDPELWLKGATKDGQRGFSLSPDGHKLAFQVGSTEAEIWALENFLPVADKRK